MKLTTLCALAAGVLWLGIGAAARAATVEFGFRGTVASVQDDHTVLDGSITAGSQLFGYASYETTLPDTFPDPTLGSYFQEIPPGAFVVEVGSYTLEVPSLTLLVYDGFDFGTFVEESFDWRFEGATFAIPGEPGASLNALIFRMESDDPTVFASDALPTAPLDAADFPPELSGFNIQGCLDSELSGFFCQPQASILISGSIDTIPEPGAAAGALAALVALGFAERRFRRA